MEIKVNAVYKKSLERLIGKLIDRNGRNRVFVRGDETRINCEIHYGKLNREGFSEVILPPEDKVGAKPDYFVLMLGLLERRDGVSRVFAENGEEKKPFYTDAERGLTRFACSAGRTWTVVSNKDGAIRKEQLTLVIQKQAGGNIALGLYREVLQVSAPAPKEEPKQVSLSAPLITEEDVDRLVAAAMGLQAAPKTDDVAGTQADLAKADKKSKGNKGKKGKGAQQ